jgi:hypothetical protein
LMTKYMAMEEASLTVTSFEQELRVHYAVAQACKPPTPTVNKISDNAKTGTNPAKPKTPGTNERRFGLTSGNSITVRSKAPSAANIDCKSCLLWGHPQEVCPLGKTSQEHSADLAKYIKKWQQKPPHDSGAPRIAAISTTTSTLTVGPTSIWTIDSGSPHHFTNDVNDLTDVREVNESFGQATGASGPLVVTHLGQFHCHYVGLDGSTYPLILNDVRYCSDLHTPLICFTRLAQAFGSLDYSQAATVTFGPSTKGDSLPANERDGILQVTLVHDQDPVRVNSVRVQDKPVRAISGDDYHNMWLHLGPMRAECLAKSLGYRITSTIPHHSCTICQMVGIKRSPFKDMTKTIRAFELVSIDTTGPHPTPSIGGSHYGWFFVETFTRFTLVNFTKGKTSEEATLILKRFDTDLIRPYADPEDIISLRSDPGGEYRSGVFEEELLRCRIKLQSTAAGCPQQNSMVESGIREAKLMAQKLLLAMHHDPVTSPLWADALRYTVCIRNITTHSGTGRIPFEHLHGKTFTGYHHLLPFGTPVVKLDTKKHPVWQPHGLPGYIYLGMAPYSSLDTAVLLAPSGHRVHSRHFRAVTQLLKQPPVESLMQGDLRSNTMAPEIDVLLSPDTSNASNIACDIMDNHLDTVDPDVDILVPHPEENSDEDSLPDEQPHRPWMGTLDYESTDQPPPREFTVDTVAYGRGLRNCPLRRVTPIIAVPKNAGEALKIPSWKHAVEEELNSLRDHEVFKITPLPSKARILKTRLLFTVKDDGRQKVRLVGKGFTQQQGLDYHESFAPTAGSMTLKAFLAMACSKGLSIVQGDVKTAFLHAPIKEELFVVLEECILALMNIKLPPNHGLRLAKSLYGTVQASRNWFLTFQTKIKEFGWSSTDAEPCIFKRGHDMLIIYVDDVMIAAKTSTLCSQALTELSTAFKMKTLGLPSRFLGLNLKFTNDNITLDQDHYVQDILKTYPDLIKREYSTPVGDIQLHEDIIMGTTRYREITGTLMYLATWTRPDISFAVSRAAACMHDPSPEDWTKLQRILGYLKAHPGFKYELRKGPLQLCCYVDADYANSVDRKSITGYLIFLGTSLIGYASKKQRVVALSTTEAEYLALGTAAQELLWIRQILHFFNHKQSGIIIYEDNEGAIKLANSNASNLRTKHIDVKHHFVKGHLIDGTIDIKHVKSKEQLADILTKGLPPAQHDYLIECLTSIHTFTHSV